MIFVLLVILALLLVILYVIYSQLLTTQPSTETVTCIMITGKDSRRIEMAKRSVMNFQEQTYPHKTLVIMNHHPSERVLSESHPNIHEVMIQKTESLNLGDMRNMALELVPVNGLFMTWDDDDYRQATLLQVMYKTLVTNRADLVAITNRYELNLTNGFVWRTSLSTGFAHVLARNRPSIRYLSKESMEDLEFIADYKRQGLRVRTLQNDPLAYIRLVHATNTSLYVDSEKRSIDRKYLESGSPYKEYEVDSKTRIKVIDIIKQKLNVAVQV